MKTKKAALAGGIVWALALFLFTWANIMSGYGTEFLKLIMSIYPGYSMTMMGSLVGLIYGFFDVFISVYIFSWVYHHLPKNWVK